MEKFDYVFKVIYNVVFVVLVCILISDITYRAIISNPRLEKQVTHLKEKIAICEGKSQEVEI